MVENITIPEHKIEKSVARVLAPNEQHIMTIHQHIIVLLKYYFYTFLACIIFFAAITVLVRSVNIVNTSTLDTAVILIGAITVGVLILVLYIVTNAYYQTVMVITNCSVVQIVQKGIVYHKVSRLTMADVEDVSSEQKGILTRILNYGNLIIQTAGEMPNFIFGYCTKPVYTTEIVLKARDQYNGTGE